MVLVHGMDSTLSKCYLNLAGASRKIGRFAGGEFWDFNIPAMPAWPAGTFLHHELSRTCDPKTKLDFVCHSAGGLIARYYAEVQGGPVERIVLQGVPNHGSDWAKLRPVIEMKQFVSALRRAIRKPSKT